VPDFTPPPPEYSILGIKLVHLVAGAIGGAIRGLSRPGESIWRRILSTAIGAIVAGYGTPVAAPIVAAQFASTGITAETAAGLCGFLLGVTGMSIVEGAIAWVKRRFDAAS